MRFELSSLPDAAISNTVKVKPMAVHIGAEIEGVDLCEPLSNAEITDIRAALLRWKVIFFRDQHMDHGQHSRFARQFGEPTPAHVVFSGADDAYPEVYSVAKHRVANSREGEALKRTWSEWHTDITAALNPPFASILRGVVVPPYGGDTHWVNLAVAYQNLSAPMRGFVDGLRCVHRFEARDGSTAYKDSIGKGALVSEHPMVRVHPETGEKSLYVSPDFVDSIVDLKPLESQKLLELLWEHSLRTEYMVRFRWEEGSVAFWDNTTTAHLAPHDIFDTDFDRQFYRITLNGEIPIGADGRSSTPISGVMIKPLGA